MSQNIISEWADPQKTQERLDANPELAKLAYEFCKRFGVKVGEHSTSGRLIVYTPSGLQGGSLLIGETYNREHKRVPVYKFTSYIVGKTKGSANSDRDTRDSTKITGLLKSIEKYNEGPTDQKLYKQYKSGIAYAFTQLGERRIERVSSPNEDILYGVFKRYLGGQTISEMPSHLVNEMGEYVKQVEKKLVEQELKKSLLYRFAGGCTLIGWSDDGNYYLIGRTRYDTQVASPNDTDKIVVEDLKRYNNIEETPHAGLAVILREYFKSKDNNHDARNAFGYRRHDAYHEEVDVSCGYAGTNIAWMLVPDEAPTV